MRISNLWTNGIKDLHQVRLSIGKTEVRFAKVQRFGHRHDHSRTQLPPLFRKFVFGFRRRLVMHPAAPDMHPRPLVRKQTPCNHSRHHKQMIRHLDLLRYPALKESMRVH